MQQRRAPEYVVLLSCEFAESCTARHRFHSHWVADIHLSYTEESDLIARPSNLCPVQCVPAYAFACAPIFPLCSALDVLCCCFVARSAFPMPELHPVELTPQHFPKRFSKERTRKAADVVVRALKVRQTWHTPAFSEQV